MILYRANYSFVARDGRVNVEHDRWPLFLVSPFWLARLNKALAECRSAGGQHE